MIKYCYWLLPLFACFAQAQVSILYVSPSGDDQNRGTLQEPLKTPHAAQARVRELIRGGVEEDILVSFAEGVYLLEQPLVFGPEDCLPGTSQHGVSYNGAAGGHTVFSGGHTLSGWTRLEGDIWQADLGGLKPFRDFYRNGKRLTRARIPNSPGLLQVEKVSEDVREITVSGLPENLPAAWANPGAELVVMQNWSVTRVPVAGVEGPSLTTTVPAGWIGHGDATTTSVGKPCYVENVRAGLDAPGEWYLDQAAGKVLYCSAPGEDPNQHEYVAPQLDQWVVLHGTPAQPLRMIHFQRIEFAYSSWQLPETGYIEIQAGHYGTTMQESTKVLPHAVELLHTQGCTFSECGFAHTGAGGVALGRGVQQYLMNACKLDDIGGNGVTIGWRGTGEMDPAAGDVALIADWPDPALTPKENRVMNCTLTRCGATAFGCVGIFAAYSEGTQIQHNLVHDMPYTGISIGYYWGTAPTSQKACTVEGNHIYDVMKMLADGGGIYTLGYQPGTVLRGNYIHDIHRSGFAHGGAPNNGIFFDEGSSGFYVTENVIHDTSGEPIRFNQTDESKFTWEGNSFGSTPESPEFPRKIADAAGHEFQPLPLIINEDNSHFFAFRSADQMTIDGLNAFVDQYANTEVTHLFLCPNSMKTSYDSDVWDAIWELGNQHPPEDEVAKKWLDNAKLLHERGLDPYAVWITRSRDRNISPWLSMRMNDIHNVDDPTMYIHSSFWADHPEFWRVPNAPGGFFERALDYAHPEVREHHLALVKELLDRYDADGIELDWMRFGWHFAPGKEAEGAEILTEFMRQVRALANAAAERRGHPVLVSARVPAHPDAARGLGMDGVRWAKEGLVDWLVPCPFWATADFDIPVELWREQLGAAWYKVQVIPGMEILLRAYPGGPQIESDLDAVYGFANNALNRGAKGLYLFNYMDPEPMKGKPRDYVKLLNHPVTRKMLNGTPQRQIITFRDTVPPGFPDGAQLPAELGKESKTFRLFCSAFEGTASLIMGLSEAGAPASLRVMVNDKALEQLEIVPQPENAPQAAQWVKGLLSQEAIKPGYNEIQVQQSEGPPRKIVWLEIDVQPSAYPIITRR